MPYSRIVGTGAYLPEKVLTNAELEKMVNTSDEWIQERTGIKQRHIASKHESTCYMAVQAAKQALSAAAIGANDVDLIILATTTPDRVFPSTACLVQKELGIDNGCAAFDVQAVCTGFVYALSVADKFIKSGSHQCALVIGAETLSKVVDWTDRSTCVLFGDGAGAVVVKASDEPGILSSHIHADGSYEHLLTVRQGVADLKGLDLDGTASQAEVNLFIEMKGNEVFRMAVTTLGRIVDETLAANQMQKSDIDWLIPHQANIRIIAATAKKLKMSMDQVIVTVDHHGNTSAASVPLALNSAVTQGKIQRGETLLLEAFGGGFTWGSVLLKY